MDDPPFGSSYPPPPPAFGPTPPSYYALQPDSYSQCGNEDVWTKHDWAFEPGMGCGRRIKWIGGQQRTQEKGNTRSTGKDQWWGGYAALYNKGEKLWKVHYDDGERECLDLLDLELAGLAQWTTFGPKDVGRRVQIYWPYKESRSLLSSVNGSLKRHCNDERGRWYGGTVAEAKRHRFFKDTPDNYFVSDAAVIKYDDGDVEILDLNKQRVQYDNSAESQIAVGTPIDILWRKQMQRFGSGTRSNSDAWYRGPSPTSSRTGAPPAAPSSTSATLTATPRRAWTCPRRSGTSSRRWGACGETADLPPLGVLGFCLFGGRRWTPVRSGGGLRAPRPVPRGAAYDDDDCVNMKSVK